jgi:hypothetical protein
MLGTKKEQLRCLGDCKMNYYSNFKHQADIRLLRLRCKEGRQRRPSGVLTESSAAAAAVTCKQLNFHLSTPSDGGHIRHE